MLKWNAKTAWNVGGSRSNTPGSVCWAAWLKERVRHPFRSNLSTTKGPFSWHVLGKDIARPVLWHPTASIEIASRAV